MKNTIWLLLSMLTICSCSCTKKPVVNSDNTIKYLALGDSYTIGESVAENERFPMQLAAKLNDSGIETEVKIIARTGWTTDELSEGIDKEKINEQKFDLVTLLIGVNNEFRNRPVSTYIPEFEALLERALTFAKGDKSRVCVLSVPDYSFTPAGAGVHENISEHIDQYNAAAREICDQKGVVFVDITPISRKCLIQPELVANDGLHPSAEQYTLWVEKLFPPVKSVLDK